ncbi:MAG: hypothetical protein QM765_21350 [Myxococcales bacterium]
MSTRTKTPSRSATLRMARTFSSQKRGSIFRPSEVILSDRLESNLLAGDGLERADALVALRDGLLLGGDVLAEHVERGAGALGLERADGPDGVVQRLAGDVAGSHAADDGQGNQRDGGDDELVEQFHGRAHV